MMPVGKLDIFHKSMWFRQNKRTMTNQENTKAPEFEGPENAASERPDQTAAEQETNTAVENEADAQIRDLQQKLEESRNRHLYLLSDFENLKRHAARDRIELVQTAGRDILAALLPVLDDFDRASRSGALNEGTSLIYQKLVNTLQGKGLHSMNVQPGAAFDPDHHEAVAEVPMPDESQKGKIVDILEQGYLLGERIIRHAKVVVGK
jgi:molecular chaperone GrpE